MKLTGHLKKQVEQAEGKEEARSLIEKAGMELTDEELDAVTGGYIPPIIFNAGDTKKSGWIKEKNM